MEERKTFFIIEIILFSLTLGLGIFTAARANEAFIVERTGIPQITFWRFILQFIAASFFVFLIIQLVKSRKQKQVIFKIFFALTVFFGGVLTLRVWTLDVISLFLITTLLVFWWRKPSIILQNLCIIFAIAGAGSFLGLLLQPETVIAFLIVFSIYDFIAVYKTKHMVKMAKEMIKSRAILGLVIPSDISSFTVSLKDVKFKGKFLVLGGGDITFPLLLCCSLVPFGILKSFIVAFFSLIGLSVSFYFFLSQKTKKAIPALPPIAFFSIVGFLITKLL